LEPPDRFPHGDFSDLSPPRPKAAFSEWLSKCIKAQSNAEAKFAFSAANDVYSLATVLVPLFFGKIGKLLSEWLWSDAACVYRLALYEMYSLFHNSSNPYNYVVCDRICNDSHQLDREELARLDAEIISLESSIEPLTEDVRLQIDAKRRKIDQIQKKIQRRLNVWNGIESNILGLRWVFFYSIFLHLNGLDCNRRSVYTRNDIARIAYLIARMTTVPSEGPLRMGMVMVMGTVRCLLARLLASDKPGDELGMLENLELFTSGKIVADSIMNDFINMLLYQLDAVDLSPDLLFPEEAAPPPPAAAAGGSNPGAGGAGRASDAESFAESGGLGWNPNPDPEEST
jgi:hypothetical protein